MKRVIHVDMLTLKCDACDYRETVSRADASKHIGRLCPVCSAVLLTRADHDAYIKTMAGIESVNRLFAAFGIGSEKPKGKTRITINPREES